MEEQMGSRRDMEKVAEKEKDKKEGKEGTEKERRLQWFEFVEEETRRIAVVKCQVEARQKEEKKKRRKMKRVGWRWSCEWQYWQLTPSTLP